MSQLITATIKNFEAVHFKQNARLVSDVDMNSVRQKMMMRQKAFKAQHAVKSVNADAEYMSQVRRAFASSAASSAAPVADSTAAQASAVTNTAPAAVTTAPAVSASAEVTNEISQTQITADAQQAVQAAYTQDRGSFEKRVATGEVSYVPELSMTIITQLPTVEFEYLGGFNYVPPSSAPDGEHVNISL